MGVMKTKSPAHFVVEIITDGTPHISDKRAFGWGDDATETKITGQPHEITIVRDGNPTLVISINEKGDVRLVNCEGMFEHLFGSTIRLKNTRQW